jgi:hypothetical protein
MFAGHLAVAIAAKRAEPAAPLGALVGASFGLDLLWPIFLLSGIESVLVEPGATAFTPLSFDSYPWSHGLLFAVFWGTLAALFMRSVGARDRAGQVGLVSLVAFVAVVWVAGPFSPPAPGPAAVAIVALSLWILPIWAWRVESHRELRSS